MTDPDPMPSRDDAIDWDQARSFLRERISAQLRPLDGPTLDDLTQEALVRLLRAVRREEATSLNGLMHEIARRTCIDLIRRRRRWAQVQRPMPEGELPAAAPTACDGRALGDPVERIRFTVLEYFRVNDAPCRSVAEAYFERQDWQSVAARLGRSHAAIRKQWWRCVQRLREAARHNPGWLADWLDEE
jgi:RNA polymerase sigma factor (sigma-70 family)